MYKDNSVFLIMRSIAFNFIIILFIVSKYINFSRALVYQI